MPLIAEDVPFLPSRIVVLSELAKKEKEKYFTILLQSRAKFHQDGFGNYIANIRMLAPGVKRGSLAQPRNPHASRRARAVPIEEAMRRLYSNEPVLVEFADCAPFDYSGFPRFVRVCSVEGPITYRTRGLSWLMKTVEDLYDAKYTQDTTEPQGQGEDARSSDNTFPVFVFRFLANKLGLKSLVDQTCWDMLGTITQLRSQHLEVEIFARFLQEFYDHDDLLFFLYVRSAIQKLLSISFKARWASSDNKNRQQGNPLWMTYRECLHVAKTVFGSEDDPMCAEFLAMVDAHIVGRKDNGKDSRRIEVMEFMHLAVVGYHHARPDEDETATMSSVRNEPVQPRGHHPQQPSIGSAHSAPVSASRPRTPQQSQYGAHTQPKPDFGRSTPSGHIGDDHDSPGALDDFLASLQRDRQALEEMQQQFGDGDASAGNADDGDGYYDEYKRYADQDYPGQPQSLASYLSGNSYPEAGDDYRAGFGEQLLSQGTGAPQGDGTGEYNEGDEYLAYQEQLRNEAMDYQRFAANLYSSTPQAGGGEQDGEGGEHQIDPETEMLLQMGQEVAYEEMSDYLDELLSSSDVAVSLPDDVLNEIREEMQIALEEKMNAMLDGLPPMQPSAFQQTIKSILASDEVQNEMTSLMTLLLTYTAGSFQVDGNDDEA